MSGSRSLISYRYGALDAAKKQIRLLTLEKNSSMCQPRCNVHVVDLASAPRFIALSYTWGAPSPTRAIVVDNRTFTVRENLYNFLCSFQTGKTIKTDIRYIYIDQICINQGNIPERNSQVRLMSDIYTRCSLVVVWLGKDPNMVKAANGIEDDMENAEEGSVPTKNLRTVLSNAYFTRLWIVQEVLLAKEIRMMIGDCELYWGAAALMAKSIDPMKTPINSLGTVSDLLDEKEKSKEWRLDEVARRYSVHECEDPRDKVYGFLGLVPESQRPVVDYAKSANEVFLDVIPIVLATYWRNKPTEKIYNHAFYGHFRVYLKNMLRLAWNMEMPDHDHRGLISMFKQIAEVEDFLSKNPDEEVDLTLTDVIDGFGYESINSPAAREEEGALVGRWWMSVAGQKYYHDCRTAREPLRQLFAYSFLSHVQRNAPDPNDPYPFDSSNYRRPTYGDSDDYDDYDDYDD